MHKTFQKIIFTLKKARGNPVPLTAFKERAEPSEGSQLKSPTQSRSGKGRSGKGKSGSTDMVTKILGDLEKYGLLEIRKNRIFPKHPFLVEARISVAPNGLGFGMGPFDRDIIIPQTKRNGANHRDKVLVELLDVSRDRYEGRVASIIESFTTRYLGKVKESLDRQNHLIHLIDLPDSPVALLKDPGQFEKGSYVIVEDTGESREIAISKEHAYHGRKFQRPFYQECQVYSLVKGLEETDASADHIRIASRFNIPVSFSKPQIPKKRDMKKLEKTGMKDRERTNLKRLYSCTIDGADSKDFDDAISFEKKGDIDILYVHIADVSHYVQKDSPLDVEAYKRGNSYYLKNSVFPMLPPILSEDFCSLKPKSKRLSFTCEMHYDQKANLLDYKIYKSIISLGKRYTYESAEKHLELPKSPLYDVWQLAKKLHKKRVASGKIELNIRETQIDVDAHGRILAMGDKPKLLSYSLIEECMLSANVCTAHFMKKNRIPGLYRVHEPMPTGGLEKINAFFKLYGFRLQLKSLHFQQIQKAIRTVEGSPVEEVFNYILLRSFSQAVYKNVPLGHWGLGFGDYTHFTSPIRRFSDLVVHRQLEAYIRENQLPYNKNQLEVIGAEVSRLERVAMDAEKTMIRLISLRFFKNKIGETYEAFLTGFNPGALFIQIQNPRVEGMIPARTFDKTEEVDIVDDFRVKLPKFSKTISLGQKLKVRLIKADWEKIQLNFEILGFLK